MNSDYRLAIIVGHSPTSPGALGVPPIMVPEFNYNSAIAEIMHEQSRNSDIEMEIFYRIPDLTSCYKQANMWTRGALVAAIMEIHYNAGPKEAFGTETLFSGGGRISGGLASVVQKNVCKTFWRTDKGDRGVKQLKLGARGYGNLTLAQVPAVIVEPFFGSNEADARLGVTLQKEYAISLLTAFGEFCKQTEEANKLH